jgi:hypothetical protein
VTSSIPEEIATGLAFSPPSLVTIGAPSAVVRLRYLPFAVDEQSQCGFLRISVGFERASGLARIEVPDQGDNPDLSVPPRWDDGAGNFERGSAEDLHR